MADELRRLIALSVHAAPSAEETIALTRQLADVAEQLARAVPDQPFPRSASLVGEGLSGGSLVDEQLPYDLFVGGFNPLAPPVRLTADPPKALGHATFGTAYEGAPGCVHGGALAATFDTILAAANSIAGVRGPTVRLLLHYRRPTLIGEEAIFEGWVTQTTKRRVFSLGRLVQGGVVTVEAEGEFAILDPEAVNRMAAGRRESFDGAMGEA